MSYAALVRVVLGVLVASVLYAVAYHRGYGNGSQSKVSYYEPILRQAADDKIAADEKATKEAERADAITSQVEASHAISEKSLIDRATAAEQRITDLLRELAARTPDGGLKLPSLPLCSTQCPGVTPGDERNSQLARSVSDVGRQCEHDASELAEWQAWYEQQRSSLMYATEKH